MAVLEICGGLSSFFNKQVIVSLNFRAIALFLDGDWGLVRAKFVKIIPYYADVTHININPDLIKTIVEILEVPTVLWKFSPDGRKIIDHEWIFGNEKRKLDQTLELIWYPQHNHIELIRLQKDHGYWKWCVKLEGLLEDWYDSGKFVEYPLEDELRHSIIQLKRMSKTNPKYHQMINTNLLMRFRSRKWVQETIDSVFHLPENVPAIDNDDYDFSYLGWTCRVPITCPSDYTKQSEKQYAVPSPVFTDVGQRHPLRCEEFPWALQQKSKLPEVRLCNLTRIIWNEYFVNYEQVGIEVDRSGIQPSVYIVTFGGYHCWLLGRIRMVEVVKENALYAQVIEHLINRQILSFPFTEDLSMSCSCRKFTGKFMRMDYTVRQLGIDISRDCYVHLNFNNVHFVCCNLNVSV